MSTKSTLITWSFSPRFCKNESKECPSCEYNKGECRYLSFSDKLKVVKDLLK